MDNKINYENWPQFVKVTTALANRKLTLKSPTLPNVLGYLLLIGGIIGLIYSIVNSELLNIENYLPNLSYILIGGANIIAAKSIKWIASNSTWEERFKNTSSIENKMIYILISLILIACLLSIVLF